MLLKTLSALSFLFLSLSSLAEESIPYYINVEYGDKLVKRPLAKESNSYYIRGSLNMIGAGVFQYMGWNSDTNCYPDMQGCAGTHKGYAWLSEQKIPFSSGGVFSIGWKLEKKWRLELSASGFQVSKALDTDFIGVYYLEKAEDPFPKSTLARPPFEKWSTKELVGTLEKAQGREDYPAEISSSRSDFRVINLLANIYYVFDLKTSLSPYIGLGLGYSLVNLRVEYSANYPDNPEFNNKQDDVFSGGAFIYRLAGGISYTHSDKLSYDLQLGWNVINDLHGKMSYEKHISQSGNDNFLRNIAYPDITLGLSYHFAGLF